MKRFLLLLTFALSAISFLAQENIDLEKKINEIVTTAMSENGVPGFSLAIVKDGDVLYRENFGLANVEHSVPVTDKSIFRVYSITKIFVATTVFEMIEEGRLSLEDSIGKYEMGLPEEWKSIKVKHLLSHSSGLPDMSPIPAYRDLSEEAAWEKVTAMDRQGNPGERYSYNQTNFYILQKILEQVSGRSLSDLVLESQFNGASEAAFFSSDSRTIIKNRATPYFPFETGKIMIDHPYLQGNYFAACNGLNITMDQFIEWDSNFRNNKFLAPESKEQMLSQFPYLHSDKKFTYGWDKRILNKHTSYGFSGSLVTAYRIFPEDDLSIILLGNGMAEFFNIEDVVNELANAVNPDIIDQAAVLTMTLMNHIESEDINGYKVSFSEALMKESFSDVDIEGIGNSIGYYLLQSSRYEEAIEVFILNTARFPASWNVYDSLGEAYSLVGNKEEVIVNYKKSLALNPNNQYGIDALKKLESE